MYWFSCYVLIQLLCTDSVVMHWFSCYVLIQLVCTDSVVMYWFSCCVLIQLLCTDSVVMYWFSCCVLIQLLCTDSVVMNWFSCYVLIQLVCTDSVVMYWFSCYVLIQLVFTDSSRYALIQLLCTDSVVTYWFSCYVLIQLLWTEPVVMYWIRRGVLTPLCMVYECGGRHGFKWHSFKNDPWLFHIWNLSRNDKYLSCFCKFNILNCSFSLKVICGSIQQIQRTKSIELNTFTKWKPMNIFLMLLK